MQQSPMRPPSFARWYLVVLVIALIPFAVAALPTMTDLPGHIGRYHVMLGGSAELARFYRFHWLPVGNLGGEIVAWVVGGWWGAEGAGRSVALLSALLPLAGIAAVSRALHGRIQPSALVAAVFVFGNPFHFGFVNYCLSLGLALLSFAVWIALADRPAFVRLAAAVPSVGATWVAHAMGWGVLGLLVAGFEGVRWWRRRSLSVAAVLPLLAFVPPVVLTIGWAWGGGGSGGPLFGYGDALVQRKVMAWVAILRGGSPILDLGAPVLLALGCGAMWWRGWLAVDVRAGAGGVLLVGACLSMPTTVLGSWAADERLAPAAAIVLAVSLRSTGGARADRALAALALSLFTARAGEAAWRWHAEDRRYQAALRVLDRVPAGATIHAVTLVDGCRAGWTANGWVHLANLAIVRRDAMVNGQWPLAASPLLRVVAPLPPDLRYNGASQVPAFGCEAPGLSALHARAQSLPGRGVAYLWVLDTRGHGDLWPGHRPVAGNGDTALYRIPPSDLSHGPPTGRMIADIRRTMAARSRRGVP